MTVASAFSGRTRADAIVTGNADLLLLEEHDGIAIVPPHAFLDLLRG